MDWSFTHPLHSTMEERYCILLLKLFSFKHKEEDSLRDEYMPLTSAVNSLQISSSTETFCASCEKNQHYLLSNSRNIKYDHSETEHTTFCVIRLANRLWFRKQTNRILWCISKFSWKDETSDLWITLQIIFLTELLCDFCLEMMGCCLVMLIILLFWRKKYIKSCELLFLFCVFLRLRSILKKKKKGFL